ncbi:MAG: hypothetical protein IIA49_12890, partial [Bacteroidetes bacterium]|nr:hypothetical protein [Bacteroidota bacterium]
MNNETDKINWPNIIEILIPLLIIMVLGWIARVVWHNRKSIGIWFKRQKLKKFPANFNIAFSLDFKDGLNSGNYFEQIKKNVNSISNKSGVYKQIIINDFSNIQKFRNKDEAESFINKKGIDLIIWGGFTNDILKVDGENINEIELHFTYGHPDDKKNIIGKMILIDISSKLAKKNYWKIVESNSLRDTKIVSNNIFDISTYIIALTLKIYGRLEKSLNLFEQLHNNLVERKDDFQKEIVPHLYNLYQVLAIENGINRKNFNLGSDLCRKILIIKKDDFFALSNLAIFQCKLGNNEEAEKLVEQLNLGAVLIIPVGNENIQKMTRLKRTKLSGDEMEIEQFVQYIKRSKTGYVDSGSQDLKVKTNSDKTKQIIYTEGKCHKCNRDNPKKIKVSFFKSQLLTIFQAGMLF